MKRIVIIAALAASTVSAAEQDAALVSCEGKSQVAVMGRIDGVITKGLPPTHTDTQVEVDVPTLVTPDMVADAAKPESPAKSMISDDKLMGMPPTSTVGNPAPTWDVATECTGYKGKFWQWRIDKCQAADPKWVSPGLGKVNK